MYTKRKLAAVLAAHRLWLMGDSTGVRANLVDANLTRANLTGAYLPRADLTDANLIDANLTDANFTRANFTRANLVGANLTDANLYGANLTGANLTYAKIAEGTIASFVLMTGQRWPVLVFFLVRSSAILQIGCKRHAAEEWAGFTDERIASMGNYALEFWREWREPLLALAKHEAGRAGI